MESKFMEPNKEMLVITRLYLEKYEFLSEADKELMRETIKFFNTPAIFYRGAHAEIFGKEA